MKAILLTATTVAALFLAALGITNPQTAQALDNHLQNTRVKVKVPGKSKQKKRSKRTAKRLTDGVYNKAWRGGKKRNILNFALPHPKRINTIRLRVNRPAVFQAVDLRFGPVNIAKITLSNPQVDAAGWLVINGIDIVTDSFKVVLFSKSKPRITEVQAFHLEEDLNCDGHNDLLVGAPRHSAGNNSANTYYGQAYIHLGGPLFDNIPHAIIDGDESGAAFADSLTSVGDVNGDGCTDYIISAFMHSTGIANSGRGRAWLYFGGKNLDTTPDLIFSGDADNAHLGKSISGIGDINNDGFDDFLLGAPAHPCRWYVQRPCILASWKCQSRYYSRSRFLR